MESDSERNDPETERTRDGQSHRLTKAERKIARKQERSKQMFLRHAADLGAELSDSSTATLLVANGGLDNGVDREMLLAAFCPFGNVDRIIMEKHKSYSFVVYESSDCAQRAAEEMNGKVLGSNSPLYISFLKVLPKGVESVDALLAPPQGLIVKPDFISVEEERSMLQFLSAHSNSQADDNATNTPGQTLKHRRVFHYGYEFRYGSNDVDVSSPLPGGLPAVVQPAVERALKEKLLQHTPDQLTVNDYQPGQGN